MATKKDNSQRKTLIGFPLIEKIIETEDFSQIKGSMATCYESLERQLKDKTGGLKKQKSIRQALKAYDLTMDLIRDLLKTKQELIENTQKNKKK